LFDIVGRGPGRRAAVGSRQHNLPGVFLPQIAGGKNPVDVGLTFFVCHHLTVGIDADAGRHPLTVRLEADENKGAVCFQITFFTGVGVFQFLPVNSFLDKMVLVITIWPKWTRILR
jgi:hypothetical protein